MHSNYGKQAYVFILIGATARGFEYKKAYRALDEFLKGIHDVLKTPEINFGQPG